MMRILFFLTGFLSVIGQTLLIREMLAIYQGNEFTLGILFSHWLLGGALGGYVASRPGFMRAVTARTGIIASILGSAILLLSGFLITRNLHSLPTLFPGESLPLDTTAWTSALVFIPLSLLIGAQFSLCVRFAAENGDTIPANRVYLLESFGYLAGGVIFTYVLLPWFSSATIILMAMTLSCIMAARLVSGKRRLCGLTAIILVGSMPFLSSYIETGTIKRVFKGYEVMEVRNSPYAQIAAARKAGETFFFIDGTPVLSFPGSDALRSEEFGHLPLLFCLKPKQVLLIGGSWKYIAPILAHPVDRLDYTEHDPDFLKMLQRYWPAYVQSQLTDPRLSIHLTDGRKLLERSTATYDAVLIGLSYPVNLSLNRFYSREFFTTVKNHLAPGGICAFTLPGSTVYLDQPLAEVNCVMRNTLRSVFGNIRIIPGDTNIFVASNAPLATRSLLKHRLAKRNISTVFISPAYIDSKLDTEKDAWLSGELDRHRHERVINYDFTPKGMLAALVYWQSIFAPVMVKIYNGIIHWSLLLWLPVLAWFIWGRSGTAGTAFSSGAAGMGLQMISIWAVQVHSGNIYHWIGLTSALFMAGLALGTGSARMLPRRAIPARVLLWSEIAFCCWISLWWLLIIFSVSVWPIFFLFSAGSGFLLGFQFPLLIAIRRSLHGHTESVSAGTIYAVDLLGGWMAAILTGTIMIPAWGFDKTIFFLLALKVISCKWWVRYNNV